MMASRSIFRAMVPQRSRRAVVMATLLFGSVLSYCLIGHLILDLMVVTGDSMYPTLHDTDRLIVHRYPFLFGDPNPGDIVALRDPEDDDLSVKRIIAVPGDAIAISNGTVEVNGSPLAEPYLGEQGCTYTATGRPYFKSALAPDQYFVLGDNRRNSIDARMYGPVARRRILGLIRSP